MDFYVHPLSTYDVDRLEIAAHSIECWPCEGRTAEPLQPCNAIAWSNGGSQCRKEAVVELVVADVDEAGTLLPPERMAVCGGHWLTHTRGRHLTVVR